LEGLKFGWKKAIRFWHYYDYNSSWSACNVASYADTPFKQLIFLTENEITLEMVICKRCYNFRKSQVKHEIKSKFQNNIREHWDDSKVCPNCKTKIIFYNSGTKDEHHCTVCDKMVVLA